MFNTFDEDSVGVKAKAGERLGCQRLLKVRTNLRVDYLRKKKMNYRFRELKFSPEGDLLLSNTIYYLYIWNVHEKRMIKNIDKHQVDAFHLPDNNTSVIVCDEYRVYVNDVETGQERYRVDYDEDSHFRGQKLAPFNESTFLHLTCGFGTENYIFLHDVRMQRRSFIPYAGLPFDLDLSPRLHEREIAVLSDKFGDVVSLDIIDLRMHLWPMKQVKTWNTQKPSGIQFHPSGTDLMSFTNQYVHTGLLRGPEQQAFREFDGLRSAAWLDDDTLITDSTDGVDMWDFGQDLDTRHHRPDTDPCIRWPEDSMVRLDSRPAGDMVCNADRKIVAGIRDRGKIKIWSLDSSD